MQSALSLLLAFVFCTTVSAFGSGPQKPAKKAPLASAPPVRFSNPATMAKPGSTYSQVVEVTGGKTVYIAGQVALDTSGTLVGPNDFRAQVEQVFKNIKAAVEAA